MRHYETIFIADPDLPPDAQESLFDKARTLIDNNAGQLVNFDEWGNRRLAYEIRKKQRGHYVRLDYCGSGETVSQLEGSFRIDERVLKFMTIFLEDGADPEALKAAVAAAKEPEETGTGAAAPAAAAEKTDDGSKTTAADTAAEDQAADSRAAAPEELPNGSADDAGESTESTEATASTDEPQ
ncbi:MAG: 30S ribosomal protein S6 [Desulfosudaceae bacterium]